MRSIFIGVVLIVIGWVAFSQLETFTPICAKGAGKVQCIPHGGISQTGYDVQRVGAWVLVVGGALLVIFGFIAGLVAWRRDSLPR